MNKTKGKKIINMENNLDKLICEEVYNFIKDKVDEIELPWTFNIPPSWSYNEIFCYENAEDFLNNVKNDISDTLKCLGYIIPKHMNERYHSFLKSKLAPELFVINDTYFKIKSYYTDNCNIKYKIEIVDIKPQNNFKVGDNVFVIIENIINSELQYNHPWKNQKYIIISCPIISTTTTNNGKILYNINFNNQLFQLSDYANSSKIEILKYHRFNKEKDILIDSTYYAFLSYNEALSDIRQKYFDKSHNLQHQLSELTYNLENIESQLLIDKSFNSDEYNNLLIHKYDKNIN